jgi:ethanolamine utilization protein EutQ (cupin superfamily)
MPAWIYLVIMSLLLTSCGESARGSLITPGIDKRQLTWSDAEKAEVFTIKKLHTAVGTSAHAVWLNGKSDARIHEGHDMTVLVLAGQLYVRMAGKWLTACAGDVIEIPRGSTYEYERSGSDAVEMYVLYYPPYNGKDARRAE